MTTKKLSLFLLLIFSSKGFSQTLSLKEVVENGIGNYGTIKAKSNYADVSKETIKQVRRDYLPNVTLSGQQDYGTVNGQNGSLYGLEELKWPIGGQFPPYKTTKTPLPRTPRPCGLIFRLIIGKKKSNFVRVALNN